MEDEGYEEQARLEEEEQAWQDDYDGAWRAEEEARELAAIQAHERGLRDEQEIAEFYDRYFHQPDDREMALVPESVAWRRVRGLPLHPELAEAEQHDRETETKWMVHQGFETLEDEITDPFPDGNRRLSESNEVEVNGNIPSPEPPPDRDDDVGNCR